MVRKKASFIIPTYNEKDNVIELIKQIYHYSGKDLYEVIVIDDNSPDGTWKIVKNLQKNYKSLRLFKRIKKKGLPSAIWLGITKAKGDYVVWLDSDLSHPPKLIPKLLSYLPRYDIVCASRYVEGGKDYRPFLRVFASQLINKLANLILNIKIKDVTSGFYAVKKEVFSKVHLIKKGYAEYCINFTYSALKKGFEIKEVGYILMDREKGSSKTSSSIYNFIYNGCLCFKEIIRLKLE